MSKNVLTETLQETSFLRGMSPEHLEKIADIAHIRDFDEHDVVFREGQSAEHVYLIVSGNVSVDICGSGPGCKQILSLGPGDLLGFSALLEQSRYTARARTPQGARLAEWKVSELTKLCNDDLGLGYDVMRRTALALAKRLSGTRMQLLNVYGEQMPVFPN
jgi:CRP-like cAMP-binding protein